MEKRKPHGLASLSGTRGILLEAPGRVEDVAPRHRHHLFSLVVKQRPFQ